MPSLRIPLALSLLLGALPAAAETPAVFHGSFAQMSGKAFQAQGLTLTPNKFHTGFPGGTLLRISFENPGAQPIEIGPQDLTLVSADQEQYLTEDAFGGRSGRAPSGMLLLPGTHMQHTYAFAGSSSALKLPARLYFKGQLLAEFTD